MKTSLKSRFILALVDSFVVVIASIITVFFKSNFHLSDISQFYLVSYIVFLIIWMIVSHFADKFRFGEEKSLRSIITSIFLSNFIILGIVTILIFFFSMTEFSRFMVFGTILIGTILESIIGMVFYSVQHSVFLKEWIGPEYLNGKGTNGDIIGFINGNHKHQNPSELSHQIIQKDFETLKASIVEESSSEVAKWITKQVNVVDIKTLLLATNTRFNIDNQPDDFFNTVVNLTEINDILRINKFFESVNSKLPNGGVFIGCGETYSLRKQRILNKYPSVINYIVYSVDFFFKRICPKLKLTRKLYFLFSRGKNRIMSRTETLGRLYSCGFNVIEEKPIEHLLFWKAKKIKEPVYDYNPTYGFLIRLRRIGKNGKRFNVYKMRTMHAYAEYVQAYIYENHHLDDSGKFKNDYRITTIGKILRKFWLDELPMLYNVLKGDMKIVGVRPLSTHYYNLYDKHLQEKRIKFKPGLIPPYYAQFPTPQSLGETQQNELEYLLEYEKRPFRTDVEYFCKAIYNIVLKKARSQ